MKREYLFILITIIIALSGVVYKGIFVSEKLDETQKLIIDNNDLNAKFNRDTLVQGRVNNLAKLHEINKRDDQSYGEVIAKLLEITEGVLKEAKIKYDVNDIEQEIEETQDWPNRKATFYINVNFETNYEDMINFINLVEKHELLINISSMSYYRIRPKTGDKKADKIDEFSVKTQLSVEVRMEYITFL